MRILVTGSAGHLGEALVRTLRDREARGRRPRHPGSPYTDHVGSIADRARASGAAWPASTRCCTPPRCTNRTSRPTAGRTSSTPTSPARSTCWKRRLPRASGPSSTPAPPACSATRWRRPPGAPAAWVTEDVTPVPKNIYGVTKAAAEDLCQLFHRNQGLPASCCAPRASSPRRTTTGGARRLCRRQPQGERISPPPRRHRGHGQRASARARARAGARLPQIHHQRDDAVHARGPARRCARDAPAVVRRRRARLRGRIRAARLAMFPRIDRVYVNERARASSAGGRATISRACSSACRAGETRAARWRGRSAPRATTPPIRGRSLSGRRALSGE